MLWTVHGVAGRIRDVVIALCPSIRDIALQRFQIHLDVVIVRCLGHLEQVAQHHRLRDAQRVVLFTLGERNGPINQAQRLGAGFPILELLANCLQLFVRVHSALPYPLHFQCTARCAHRTSRRKSTADRHALQ